MLTVAMMVAAGCKPEENNDADVRVTTYIPQDVTVTTAKCGGDVIVTQGLSLTELGVCWSTEPNPTASDTHCSTTNWSEPYVCTITGLEPSTKYHVRAYALRGLEYYYGDDKDFTTKGSGGGNGTYNGHDYVDLGLPSGTLWATCNVGANNPEEYGKYFAWGEITPKITYNWGSYQYCNGDYDKLTKYCNNSSFGYNNFTDDLTTLLPEDDGATANWGNGWCMPTADQWRELRDNTICAWTTLNGVNGHLLTATNGVSLFFPAAGYHHDDELDDPGNGGYYWASSLRVDYPGYAWYYGLGSGNYGVYPSGYRYVGFSIRPVRSARQN